MLKKKRKKELSTNILPNKHTHFKWLLYMKLNEPLEKYSLKDFYVIFYIKYFFRCMDNP